MYNGKFVTSVICAAGSSSRMKGAAGKSKQLLFFDGMTVIEWQELSDTGKLLVDTWFLGICRINEKYNCIMFT